MSSAPSSVVLLQFFLAFFRVGSTDACKDIATCNNQSGAANVMLALLRQVRLADVKLTDQRDQQRRTETPPRVLMKNRQAQDRARAAAAAANGQGAGQPNSRYLCNSLCMASSNIGPCAMGTYCLVISYSVSLLFTDMRGLAIAGMRVMHHSHANW